MPSNRVDRIEEIFHAALALPAPERPAFVEAQCGGDHDLHTEVEALLECDSEQGDGLARLDQKALGIGDHVGPYVLRERLGEGGMGLVYRAEQLEPVRRMVAVKILKPGLDSKEVVARFEAERQALALMDHPNIAKVYDVGTTDDGRPYFAMELIEGVPITEYCDVSNLTLTDRVRLLVPVCRGVQHAHQNGVIHRDLKPSNVLVALRDRQPVPTIIDFGIAKAIASPLTDRTLYTAHHQILGTLEYMSPEQAEMSPLRIDTRSDVYSLGVLLYELMVGVTPLDTATLRQAAFLEAQRLICESEPPRPSTRISTLGARAAEIARHRRVDLRTLSQHVRGDLDWITMRCLEKDLRRRYQSASELADDLERHLRDEPVLAGSPGFGYRLRKFARRHRIATAVSVVIALSTVIAVAAVVHEHQKTVIANQKLLAVDYADKLRRVEESIDLGRSTQDRRRLLDSIPVSERGFSWSWLNARCEAPPAVLDKLPTETLVRSVDWHPDGQHLLTVRIVPEGDFMTLSEATGVVGLLSVDQGKWLWEEETPSAYIARFLPGGQRFVTGDTATIRTGPTATIGRIRLRDLGTGAELARGDHGAAVLALSVSRDGRSIASAGADGSVCLWDAELAECTRLAFRFDAAIRAIDFSPDGQRLLVAGDSDTAVIVDTTGAKPPLRLVYSRRRQHKVRGYRAAGGSIRAAAFSPDGKLVALGGDDEGYLGLWDATDGGLVRHLWKPKAVGSSPRLVTSVAFDAEGRWLISCGFDHQLSVFSVRTGHRLATLWHGDFGWSTTIHPTTGRVAVTACEAAYADDTAPGHVSVWSLGDLPLPVELFGHVGTPTALLTTADGRYAFVTDRQSVCKLDLETGQPVFNLRRSWMRPQCLALRPPLGHELAVGGVNGRGLILDAKTGEVLREFELPFDVHRPTWTTMPLGFSSLRYSPQGDRLAAGAGALKLQRDPDAPAPVYLLDANTCEQLVVLSGHQGAVNAIDFTPDGARLITASPQKMIFWGLETPTPHVIEEQLGRVTQLGLDPGSGLLFARTEDQRISTFDPSTGKLLAPSTVAHGNVPGFDLDPTGREALLTEAGGITTWDVRSWNRFLSRSIERSSHYSALTRFAGTRGLVTAGGLGSLTYHEVEPRPELFETRRLWYRAARLVRERTWSSEVAESEPVSFVKLTKVNLVSEVVASVKTDPDLPPQVRDAALEILDHTTENAKQIWLLALNMLSAGTPEDVPRALEYARAALPLAQPGTFKKGAFQFVYGMALYRHGQYRAAIDELTKALAAEDLVEMARTDWGPSEVTNTNLLRPLLALAHHALGETDQAHDWLEESWKEVLGGPTDVSFMGQAYARLGIGTAKADPHSAMTAAGPPDAAIWKFTHGNAWFPAIDRHTEEWLELDYAEATHVSELWIYEIAGPGAVVRVVAIDEQGGEQTLWQGEDPTTEPGVFRVPCKPTDLATKTIKVFVDRSGTLGDAGPGLDTVRLVGPDTKQWPVRASASSSRGRSH